MFWSKKIWVKYRSKRVFNKIVEVSQLLNKEIGSFNFDILDDELLF